MSTKALDMQATIYVYDLNNTAREFGFKHDEGWELNVATQEEKIYLEKKYHPIISSKMMPEILSEMFGLVKSKLTQTAANISNNLQTGTIQNPELQYLVAFNPKRSRY